MKKVIGIIIILTMWFQLQGQKITVCYKYKIQYQGRANKDNTKLLISMRYYNAKMEATKEVVFGPSESDRCWTLWKYDTYGNLIEELDECSNKRNMGLLRRQYDYAEKGKIIRETSLRTKPYFELYTTEYNKDTTIRKSYQNQKKAMQDEFERKDVDVCNSVGKRILSYSVNNKGDTVMSHAYIYLPLEDTLKVRANPQFYFNPNTKLIQADIIYMNSIDEEEVIDYYSGLKFEGRSIKRYNTKKELILEQYFSKAKDKIISELRYFYDTTGVLLRKEYDNFDDQLKKISKYKQGKIVREDYIYEAGLNHSIIYVYRINLK
jgi:hypothetical protein